MDIISFLHRLDKEGIKLVLKNGALNIKANAEINPETIQELKSNKQQIIDHLKAYEEEGATNELQLPKITAYNKENIDRIPLSFNQERLWFLDQLDGSVEYHMPTVIRLEGALNIPMLEQAFKTIVTRHEVLRTNILADEGKGYQEVVSADNWSLDQVNGADESTLTETLVNFISVPFNLAVDYKFRACLYHLENDKYVLACVFHHIVSDGWAEGILINEFMTLYSALQAGKSIELPELTLQYSDYAIWQREHLEGEILDNQIAYWKKKLEDVSTLTLPKDHKRSAISNKEGANLVLQLDKKLRDNLQALCNQEGVTLFMLLLSAFKVLLSRYSGQSDICVGTPVANRTQSDLEGMIGFFVNTLALRTDLGGNPSFKELLKKVKATTLDGYDNQLAPFEKVVDTVLTDRDISITPLFQVMFVLQNTSPAISEGGEALDLGGVEISGYGFEGKTAKFDLTLDISESDSGIVLDMAYRTASFDEATIMRMLAHYENLLTAIVDNIRQPIHDLSLLTSEEENQLLHVYNDTSFEYPKGLTIIDFFKENVAKAPNAIAVSFEGKTISYQDLDKYSNQLAHYLVEQGIQPNDFLGICMDRGLELVVAILGTLKTGAAYIPIDPTYPEDRINYMLSDASINLVLSDAMSSEVLTESEEFSIIRIDKDWDKITSYPETSINVNITTDSLAYVIYTSGSTGKPKGVMVEHRNLVHLCFWHQSAFSVTASSRGSLFAGVGFDASVWEIFPYLLGGASLYPITGENRYDLKLFSTFLNENKITHAYVPTLLCENFIDADISLPSTTILTGGDALSLSKETSLTIYNNYGPTEATVVATYCKVSPTDSSNEKPPIGKPISNAQVYIVDSAMNVSPVGVVGELCIGGSGVARGYLNREELTKEKFVSNPFKEGERIYKTGDLVRWLQDGNIEFVGRKDTQVKIRGYRIELGEIESALSNLDSISQSCVLAKQDANGVKRLVAYVVPTDELNKEKVQQELKEVLPEYMVPSILIELDEMPLTSNGKLDKKALPEPDGAMLSTKEYVAPRNEVEEQLTLIWQELLGVEKIGVYDNFFELGGHSLLVVQLIARLQKIDYYIQVKDLFSNPTIESLSKKVSSEGEFYEVPANGIIEGIDSITPEMVPLLDFVQEDIDKVVSKIPNGVANIQDIYPLSPLQEGIHFHYLMSDKEEGDPYVLSDLLVFTDLEKRTSFIEALQFVMNRHDVLRTCVLSDGLPNAVQVVLREVELSIENLDIDASKDVLEELQILSAPGNQWMDVSKAPLLKLKLANDEEKGHYFLWVNHHHLLFDHVGLDKIIEEIAIYSIGQEASLPEPVLYREFIGHTLHLQASNDSESYFKELLGDIDEPTYPFDLSNVQGTGGNVKESIANLPEELSLKVRNVCTTLGVSPGVLFHAAFGMVVGKCSNKEYALFGSLLSGRLQGSAGAADSLGLFINTLPFFTELKGSVSEYILEVKNALGSLLTYEQTPLSSVQGWSGVSNEVPLFSALLNFRHSPLVAQEEVSEDSVDLGMGLVEAHERTNYPFSLDVDDYGTDFALKVQVDESLSSEAVLSYMVEAIEGLVTGVEKQKTVSEITILPEEEKINILEGFNNNEVEYPFNETVVELFTKQVERTPNAVAAIFEGQNLTYKQLNERSNQLAHYLLEKGTQSEELIGICLNRGLEMLIGVLGILKSGGAYVPMKPDFPEDRIASILEDTACNLLITDKASQSSLASFDNLELIVLDDKSLIELNLPITSVNVSISSNSLAYVIYTSGSTGIPKGAMIEHAGLLNHSLIMVDELKMTNKSVVAFTAPFTFDISVWQMLSGLLCGGSIAIYSEDMLLDIDGFQNSLFENEVSHLQLVPSYISNLLETDTVSEGLSNLAYFLVTGEAATKSLLDKWFSLYPSIPVINAYGPAEASDDVTLHIMYESPKGAVVPIGKPVANMDVYVVDAFNSLCPVGVVGELWTSGIGVGRGYLNREELTKEKFIENQFKSEGGRLYKTGDLGRWLPNGTLEFVGRSDDQVKVRGYRIELGEIENALSVVSGIQQSCVLAKKDINEINHLIAYVVVEGSLNKEAIQEELKLSLPDYMVPMIWIELEEMPLTPNGKLDKKALPELDGATLSTKTFIAPRNEKEEKVAAVWRKLFAIDRIGINDNFFELGGNSLLVIKLISKLQNVGFNIGIKEIFSNPTIAGISENLLSGASIYQVPPNGITVDTKEITPEMVPLLDFEQKDIDKVVTNVQGGIGNIEDIYPLSPLQEGIYFHHLMSTKEEGDPYVLPHLLAFSDEEKRNSFIDALQYVVNRHDVLRTSVISEGLPKAVQVVHKEAQLSVEKSIIADDVEDVIAELKRENAPGKLWVDASEAPLMKLKAIDDPKNNGYYLVLLEHHLMFDHIGVEKVVDEVTMCLLGEHSNLPEPVLYRNFIGHTLHLQKTNDSEAYFKNIYTDIEEPTYPFELVDVKGTGTSIQESRIILPEELSKSIREVSTKYGMSPAVLFHAAFGLVIGKCSNKNHAIFGSLFSGRLQGSLGVEDSLGMFINTLPFLARLNGNVAEYINLVKEHLNGLLSYEQTPLSSIQSWTDIPNDVPFFNALLNFRHGNLSTTNDRETEPVDLGVYMISSEERTNYPFSLSVDDYGDAFGLIAQIEESIPADRVTSYMREALIQLLDGLNKDINVTDLSILTEKEEVQLLKEFNETLIEYPEEKTIIDLFSTQVEQNPEAIAVVDREEKLSYKELDELSNQLSNYILANYTINNETFVAVTLERSNWLIVSFLAVLKSGGTYVPIDPSYPEERKEYIKTDSNSSFVIDQAFLTSFKKDIDKYNNSTPEVIVKANDLAYVIYTSGSTGKPKGVMIEHYSIINTILSQIANFSIDNNDNCLQFASPSFDASIWEIGIALLSGASLCIVSEEGKSDVALFKKFIEEQRITFATLPPAFLQLLEVEDIPTIKTLVTAGEAIPLKLAKAFSESYNYINAYGPTETSICATTFNGKIGDLVPIGKPIHNTEVYILNDSNELLPSGVVGELCVGGRGVARGYLNREELTNEKFIKNPFKEEERIYKTGDLAKWLSDGTIEFVGRKDNQVKIRGYRIELGEVENALATLTEVNQCCVLAKNDVGGNKQLVAYVVTKGDFHKESLQNELLKTLPEYMVPMIWVELEGIPVTSNGKLDRKALPEPDGSMLSTQAYIAPRNETEEQLVTIWQELLNIEKIGVYDNFFELGGHSLLIVQLISRLQGIGYHTTVNDIFSEPTIAGIAEKVLSVDAMYVVPANKITENVDQIVPEMLPLLQGFDQENIEKIVAQTKGGIANIQDMYPLSPLQEGIYFHYLMSNEEQGDPYVLPNLLSFSSSEKRSVFIEALQFVVNRNDVLRTGVISEGLPQAVQVVLKEATLQIEELTFDSGIEIESELKKMLEPGKNWIDLTNAPILQLKSADDTVSGKYYLLINQHHLIFDHVGLEIIISEIEMYLAGKASMLPEPALYREFIGHVLHLQSENDSEVYFKELFEDIDEPTYPFELATVRGNEGTIKDANVVLSEELTEEIRKVSVELGISPAVLFHAAYGILVGRFSGKEYAVFGSLFSGRLQGSVGAANSLGLFINTLPFLVELKGNVTGYIQTVKQTLGDLLPHEQTPLPRIHGWSGISNDVPLFSALFNFRHSEISTEEVEAHGDMMDLEMDLISGNERTNYPFGVYVDDYGIGFGITVQVDESIDPESILTYMQEALTGLLSGLKSEETVAISRVGILPEEEELQLREEFNTAEVNYPKDKTLVDLFIEQVKDTPNAVAVVYEGVELTYKELDKKSNQLARYLREEGVQSNDLVGICLERSLEMIIGILGILKSGGAYVPVDPDYPEDRIDYTLTDAGIRLVLSSEASKQSLKSRDELTVVSLDGDWNAISEFSTRKLSYKGMTPNDLAYVIYTSGSTGKPKGVLIEHINVVRLFVNDECLYDFSSNDVWTLFHSFCFDFSVWEMYGALLFGGRLVIVPKAVTRDMASYTQLLVNEGVTVLNQTPSSFYTLQEEFLTADVTSNAIRYVIFGGEALNPTYLKEWKETYSECKLINMYGITETTVHVTYKEITSAEILTPASTIGTAIPTLSCYVVDNHLNLVPKGVIGELCIGGAGVARGYLNREKLTNERFVSNPFSNEDNSRLYKSGDLGRWLPDGSIEYVGRKDHQVKIRGYRIELGEIESALLAIDTINQCCILAKEDATGTNQLIGYIVVEGALDKEFLQEELKESLPDYMVPTIWIALDAMPLTSNGKLDRKSLPDPDGSMFSTREYVAPRTEIEEQLVAIWQELLGLEKVGVYDNFFELGGHSLLATRLISIVNKELDIKIEIVDIFEFDCIEQLANYIGVISLNKIEDEDEYVTTISL
ncbi:amino acid adenylation domain-containing protein [Tenacibaculum sp. MAR_2009_124]|uniref:non-ribosomal peptide synthetase n=1 Tax=Tenacibaculum sp. MAR_2009_124 TaxID=1250059 RepID=UPI000899FC95|nr:non-ribosomal peptide synthetase [Tenacibaculum sp. MAR_2009_124]SEB35185.1 amino acid adenylation domain-containing protein [Tenacibaculum sp. MAR_2009_124]